LPVLTGLSFRFVLNGGGDHDDDAGDERGGDAVGPYHFFAPCLGS
jgi:hypothetical protein